MRKLLPLLALVLAAAAVLTGCNVRVGPYAAVVDGVTISQSDLNAGVSSAAADSGYICSITSNYTSSIATYGVGKGRYGASFTDFVLETFVQGQLLADAAAARHLEVGTYLPPIALAQLTQSFGSSAVQGCSGAGTDIFEGLSVGYRSALLQFYENLDLLGAADDGVTMTSAGLSAYAAAHPTSAELTCLGFVEATSRADAVKAEQALKAGTSLVNVAAKYSEATSDTIPCSPLSEFPASLSKSFTSLPVGGVGAPVSYQGAYIVFVVQERQPSTPAQIAELVVTNAQKHFSSILKSIDTSPSVQIDPTYGTWSRSEAQEPITAPQAPAKRFVPSPAAVTPAPASAPTTTTTTTLPPKG